MARKKLEEPEKWITVNGQHLPVYPGGRIGSPGQKEPTKSNSAKKTTTQPKMGKINDSGNFYRDMEHMPEETFLNKYFGRFMGRFGKDVVTDHSNDWWEISSSYNTKDLANMFAKSFKDAFYSESSGAPKVSVFSNGKDSQSVDIKLGKYSGVEVKIYRDDEASTWEDNHKGYSVDIEYYS